MAQFYVAAVRDWDESRMTKDFKYATEIGSEKSFATNDYKTIRGLVKYCIQEHPLYYGHVWAVFRSDGSTEKFVGLEYNQYDSQLCDLAARYMRCRNRVRHNALRISGHPLSVRA